MIVPNISFVFDRKKVSDNNKVASVELLISTGKARKYISTGVRLTKREWSNGSVVGRKDWKELNEQLHVIKQKCSDIVSQMMREESIDLNAIPNRLKDSMTAGRTFLEYSKEIAQLRYKKIRPGTKEHYLLWFRFMESWGGIVYFSDLTPVNVLKMEDKLVDMGLKEVSRWSYHKILKTFIFQAIDDGLIKKNPYSRLDIKKGREDGLKRFLSPSEFKMVEKAKMPSESLQKVRDLFCFQTYTLLSYSDLALFDYKRCEKIGNEIVYKAKRVKTGQEFVVVLLKPALEILKRYQYRLPIISNVKYNLYLKAVAQHAKVDKPLTTHYARHTGATLLLNEGKLPMHIVQHILGHASIRETEKTYAKVMDETIVGAMAGYKQKKGKH